MTRSVEIDQDILYTGQSVECTVCHRRKKPDGRSAAPEMEMSLCGSDCVGYHQPPYPGDLWPGERREDFGFPAELAKKARELRGAA